jgi:hypothetical protein
MRLALAYDGDNGDTYAATPAEFVSCESCCVNVITSVMCVLVAVLDERPGDWRTAMSDQLAALLDTITERP